MSNGDGKGGGNVQNWSVNSGGTGNNVNLGNTFNGSVSFQHNINSGPEPTDIFTVIRESLKDVPAEEIEKLETEVIKPMEALCKEPVPETEKEQAKLKDKILSYVGKLSPYAPFIRQTVASFAEGALKTIAPPMSWVIGGCLEVIRQQRGN